MADNRIKDFGFTWNLEQVFQYVSEFRSPKIHVCAANYIQFCLTYKGKETFEVKIEKNDDLEISLGDCDVSCISDRSISFFNKRCSDLPGWSVQWKPSLDGKTTSSDLKITIQLFLREHLNPNPTISSSDNISFKKLSRDMKQLLNTGKLSDLNLVVGNEEFKVHKAIIAARTPKIEDILELGANSSEISSKEITCVAAPVLKLLLRYLYSGEFDINQRDIPVGLSTTLDALKLDVLKSKLYAYPNHTSVSTHLHTATHSFVWPIKNFVTLLPGTILTSPIVYPYHLCELQLRLRKETIVNLSEEAVQVTIALDTNYKRENCHLQFEIYLVDVFGDCTHARSFDVGEAEWYTALSVKRSELVLHPEDTLSLLFKLTMRRPENEIVGSESTSASLPECCANPCDLTSLSADLNNLYQSGKFSDLTVQAGGHLFKVHKAIISARSPKLFEAFELQTAPSNPSWAVTDIEPSVLERLLDYIYSGKAVQSNCSSATKLYLSAYKYDLSPLKVDCLSYIKSNITF